MKHVWEIKDDLIVFLIKHARFDQEREQNLIEEVSKIIGCKPEAFKMRISNFNHLSGDIPSLSNPAKSTKEVRKRFIDFFE